MAVLTRVSELRHHSLAHLEGLDGEGRVSGYGSGETHGAVAVDVLAGYAVHFLRHRAKDGADGALFWRLRGTHRRTGEVGAQITATSTKNGCKRKKKTKKKQLFMVRHLETFLLFPTCVFLASTEPNSPPPFFFWFFVLIPHIGNTFWRARSACEKQPAPKLWLLAAFSSFSDPWRYLP